MKPEAEAAHGLFPLPDGATGHRIALDPYPSVTSLFPERTYEIRRADEQSPRKVPLGPLALRMAWSPHAGWGQTPALGHLHELRNGQALPLQIGNVGSDGGICWGSGRNYPYSPRQGWSIFWSAPFNWDLTPVPPHTLIDHDKVEEVRRAARLKAQAAFDLSKYPHPTWAPTKPDIGVETLSALSPSVRAAKAQERATFLARSAGQLTDPVKAARQATRRDRLRQYISRIAGNAWAAGIERNLNELLGYYRQLYSYHRDGNNFGVEEYAQAIRQTIDSIQRRAGRCWSWVQLRLKELAWEGYLATVNDTRPAEDAAERVERARQASGVRDTFYNGDWRRYVRGVDASRYLNGGAGVVGPGSASHALLSADKALLRMVPRGYLQRDILSPTDGLPRPHPECRICGGDSKGVYVVGFGFSQPGRAEIGVLVMDPKGALPALRIIYHPADGWQVWGSRAAARKTDNQRKRDRRHVLRMRTLLDRRVAEWVAARVTLPARTPMEEHERNQAQAS